MEYVPYDPLILKNMADYILNSGGTIFGSAIVIFAVVLLPSIIVRLSKIFTKH